MRTASMFAMTFLAAGSAWLASPAAHAQAAAPQPTASVTLPVASGDGATANTTETATTDVAPAMPPGAITATTTIVAAPGTPAVPPGTTASATLLVPADAPAPAADATATTGEVIDPATYQKRTEFDNTPWRFNMEQDGRRMTADEFTAWMEARGVRVARGPKAHQPANRTNDGLPAPGSAMPLGAAAPVAVMAAASPAPAAPAATGAGLQAGSVTPTDDWNEDAAVAVPTTSATVVLPAADAEPLPPQDAEAR